MECYIYVALQSLIFWKPFQVPCSEVVQAACVLPQLKAGGKMKFMWNYFKKKLRYIPIQYPNEENFSVIYIQWFLHNFLWCDINCHTHNNKIKVKHLFRSVMYGYFSMENISKQKEVYYLTSAATQLYTSKMIIQNTSNVITYQLM